MEAAPSVKSRRGPPPIPPNYVSLRQLQELRLKEKEEQEKRQREEEAAAKREAARKPETKVSAVVPVDPIWAKERRDGGLGPQWVAVAHRPAVPPPARREAVSEAVPIGVGRGNKGPAHAPRGGGRPEGKEKGEGKEKVSAVASAQTRTDGEPGKLAEASSHGGKSENKGQGKGKAKAKASGDTGVEPDSILGSGESAGASSRRRKNPKVKKRRGGRSAEPSPDSAPAKTAGASPPQGVKPKSPGGRRADANPVSDSSHGNKANATPAPAPPTSAAAGSFGELRITAEGLLEAPRRPPTMEAKGAAEQMPRVVGRRAWPRPRGDRCNGAGEQHGRVWVPKAATGCAELGNC